MPRYTQAASTVPEPCKVLGTSLRPFCLGHHLLFKRLKLPFCGNALAQASDEDLLIGIAICAQRYEETLDQFLTGEWTKVFSKWKRDLTKQFSGWSIFRKRIDRGNLPKGICLFRSYLQDGYEHPPIWKYQTVNGITLSGPWEIVLKNRLIMAGYSETDTFNGYLPARWYDYYCVTELAAAANCADEKKWRKVFFNEQDFNKLSKPKGIN